MAWSAILDRVKARAPWLLAIAAIAFPARADELGDAGLTSGDGAVPTEALPPGPDPTTRPEGDTAVPPSTVEPVTPEPSAEFDWPASPDEPTREPARPVARAKWYGGQTLAVDGVSFGMLFAVPVLGGFGYLFGGPVVHAVHGQGGVGAGSFLLRVGMPVMGAFLGCAIQGDSSGEFSCLGGALVGFGLGALGVVVIDASLLAYEEPQENPKKPRILTMGHATRHGGQIGIAGSF